MADGMKFSPDAAKRIAETVRAHENEPPPSRVRDVARYRNQNIVEGFYAEGLLAPDDAAEPSDIVPTTADFYPARGDGTDWEVQEEVGDVITVTNRRPEFSAASGDYGLVVKVNGEWRPVQLNTSRATPGGGTGEYYQGCEFTDCFDPESPWFVDAACGGCSRLPRAYVLKFPITNGDNDCPLYAKRFYEGFSTIQGYFDWWVLEKVEPANASDCVYESPEFECDTTIDGNCGTSTWRWNSGFRDVDCSVTWTWTEVDCPQSECRHKYQWVYITPPGYWQYVTQEGDCPGGVTSPSPPTDVLGPGDHGTIRYVDCTPVNAARWVCSNAFRQPECANCDNQSGCNEGGATILPPSSPGSSFGDTVTNTCTITVPDETMTGWELIGECACGTSDPPSRDGLSEGETVTTACHQEDGYSNPTIYKWRLTVDGCDSTLELVNGSTVVWTYQPLTPRCWCCNCTNTMVPISCGPFPPPYYPPSPACLVPARYAVCETIAVTTFDVEIAGFPDGDPNECSNFNATHTVYSPVPLYDELSETTVSQWPNETDDEKELWRVFFGPPTACDEHPCEWHSPIIHVAREGDVDMLYGVSVCVSSSGGMVGIRVGLHVAEEGSIGGGAIVTYSVSDVDVSDTEWTLTRVETGSGDSTCGATYDELPLTITVRRGAE